MTGILLINKPAGFTSFDVIAKMRGISKIRKIGHAGTLDPMATGVLPLFFEGATKACDIMPNQDKRYRARFRLGLTTDTQDITGKVLSEAPVMATTADVQAVLERFAGDIEQLPPMYSAIQVNGQRLYDLAREGKTIERETRPVTVYELNLLESDDIAHTYTIDVSCSKGTYIRTICHDIGEALGCGATLTELCRTEAAGFMLRDCITLEQAQQESQAGTLFERLLPIESVFAALPRVTLDERRAKLFQNGVRLDLVRNKIPRIDGTFAVYGGETKFLGIAHNDYDKNELHMDKLFSLV
ncbi:tRNA pseudouridine(55) synthase TruB [Hydrogenoanaerobacterium sp.]|uniref:tRNA pseudouridine(55) synthase TruB n=1 Tax=Hydrogenoanaerobacterium sp. TaxID=2953763 RepID=UPI00289B506A|nr:tRNA pseudouridine(55) synthase TruB [Hydrogenoanaerobacterium sp.]